jgi:predicted RecB family nuclease
MEYLADPPEKDCRRELAENLIKALEEEGSIIVYSGFEKTIITKLSGLYPELSEKLNLILDRLVDLEKIIRNNYYHPDFHGSTSIKKTLPVLVPGMSYKNLRIAEGDTAMVTFALMAQGKYDRNEIIEIRKNLLTYCEQDTRAMVELHKRLEEITL